jgi:predicted CXXCH cytochrome family protein
MTGIKAIPFIVACVFVLGGCDPLTMHKVTATVFDGVPSLPPAEQYCKDYHAQATQEELKTAKKSQKNVAQDSKHPPYIEKRCNDCHNKETESGFVVAREALCAHCHKGFPEGSFLHGPAAVGACLKCHVPHTAQNPNLLVKPKGELCITCHAETRVAQGLHSKMVTMGVECTACHDPHGGNNRYFLR